MPRACKESRSYVPGIGIHVRIQEYYAPTRKAPAQGKKMKIVVQYVVEFVTITTITKREILYKMWPYHPIKLNHFQTTESMCDFVLEKKAFYRWPEKTFLRTFKSKITQRLNQKVAELAGQKYSPFGKKSDSFCTRGFNQRNDIPIGKLVA